MTELINIDEVNEVLFPNGRSPFPLGEKGEFETVELKDTDDAAILARFYKHEKKSANILFFPSTHLPLEDAEEMAKGYTDHGFNLLVLSYRTDNSKETGLNPETFLADGRTLGEQALQWLDSNGYEGAKFIMGQSLGSAVAIDFVAENPDPLKGLLLESSICQTMNYLKSKGVDTDRLGVDESAGFGNIEKIEKIKLATLIFHGARDEFIPIVDAEKLQACSGARTKQFFIIPGATHDHLYRAGGKLYFETIKKFMETVCGVNTWRQKRRKYQQSRGK